jgi:S1-C subfamily serine protease
MQLNYTCPHCETEQDFPWSMVGKPATCRRCSHGFVVPAPFEPVAPKSSEAIPVAKGQEAPPPPPVARTVRLQAPPPQPAPRPVPIDGLTAAHLAPLREEATEHDHPPPPPPPPVKPRRRSQDGDRAAFEPIIEPPRKPKKPRPVEPAYTPAPLVPPKVLEMLGNLKMPRMPRMPGASTGHSGHPPWLIPSIVGGGIALILMVNIGFYIAYFGLGGSGQAGPNPADQPAPPTTAISPHARVAPEAFPGADSEPAPSIPVPPAPNVVAPPAPTVRKQPVPPARLAEEVPDRPMNTAEIVARYEPSVALIKGKKGSGTGFIARPGIVATNAHVIEGERIKEVEVRFPSAPEGQQGPLPARLLYKDKDRDLALLGVATDLPPVRIAKGYKFRKGEDVTVIGNPGVGGRMILENAISRGIVSSMTKINEHTFLQLGIAINPGNSGGPVFDPKGRVIGVVTLKTTAQEALAFAIPAEDLLAALDAAETPSAAADPLEGPGGAKDPPPALSYGFRPGQAYAYSLEVTIDNGNGRVVLSGSSVYRVKGVDADGITMTHNGRITTTKKGKDGKALPGGVNGPEPTREVELKIDDKGYVLKASGSSPLPLLGDFAMLIIEPLPDDVTASWDDSQTIALKEVEQTPGASPRLGRPGLDAMPTGPRARPGSRSRINSRPGSRPPSPPPPQPQLRVILHEAAEETKYTLGAQVGDLAPIRKVYELATRETVGDAPRLKMTGDGTLSFDVKAGIPLSLDYKLDVVEVAGNARIKIPITVTCKLLEGRDRDKALRPPQ